MRSLRNLITGKKFDRFQDGLKSRFLAHRIDYSYNYTNDTTPCLILNFRNAKYASQAKLAESGSLELIAKDNQSGRVMFSQTFQIATADEFHELYPKLVLFMEGKDTEQSVPGYPPQGVGSPEP